MQIFDRQRNRPITAVTALMPLALTDIQELLSFTYIRAIAARAGFRVHHPYPDRAHDDLQIDACGRLEPNGWSAAKLELQVRATTTIPLAADGDFGFQIERGLYDSLRDAQRLIPLLLVVYIMPREPEQWLTCSADALMARHGAYWCNLKNAPAIDTESRVVRIPWRNTLTVDSLTQLMILAGRRAEIGNAL